MSLKKSPDWKGKIQWVLTNRKPKFKVKKNPDKTSTKKILYSAVCRKSRSYQIKILLRGEVNQYVNILYSS